jgi:hypothetical protein
MHTFLSCVSEYRYTATMQLNGDTSYYHLPYPIQRPSVDDDGGPCAEALISVWGEEDHSCRASVWMAAAFHSPPV